MLTGVFKTSSNRVASLRADPLSRILNSKVLREHHFVRHAEVGPFVVEHLCRERGVIIELLRPDCDLSRRRARVQFLTEMGYRVLQLSPRELASPSAVSRIRAVLRG